MRKRKDVTCVADLANLELTDKDASVWFARRSCFQSATIDTSLAATNVTKGTLMIGMN